MMRWALLSVTDKSQITELAQGLIKAGYGLLSTGGTAKVLQAAQIPVTEVSLYTDSAEILGGRVKTLHPKIHGGILYDRNNAAHQAEAQAQGIDPIDILVVNLYDFVNDAIRKETPMEQAIEAIDIGGPTMLRAAAKNYSSCVPLMDPADYPEFLSELASGKLSAELRQRLARKTFARISAYDASIAEYMGQDSSEGGLPLSFGPFVNDQPALRYGENPQQRAASLRHVAGEPILPLQGKPLSYNNMIDCDAAHQLVQDLSEWKAISIIKHTNPCGCAVHSEQPLAEIFARALAADPKSAFGGIVGSNQPIDAATAEKIAEHFFECVVAPSFDEEARQILAAKKNLRLIERGSRGPQLQLRAALGQLLVQSPDRGRVDEANWQIKTEKKPSDTERGDLRFAMIVAKHVKSNAIVYAKDLQTIAIGAGQMSRIDAAQMAATKAADEGRSLAGSVMASDAFFPFRDSVDAAAERGVKAIIQPGGSKRDQESIDACAEHAMSMVFTGERHFRH